MNNRTPQSIGVSTNTDVGLRNFMLGTYRYMAMAMAVTAGVAYFVSQYLMANPSMIGILRHPFVIIGFILAIPLLFGSVANKLYSMSLGGVLTFLFGFAAFMGVFTSVIILRFDAEIIARVFFMTVAMFASLSFFGHTTKRDLSTYVKYAFAAFIGYIAIHVIGMFIPAVRPTGMADTVISLIALLAIAVITAWQTQALKQQYYQVAGHAGMESKVAAFGAASLLLSFINMFQILLSLFGRD